MGFFSHGLALSREKRTEWTPPRGHRQLSLSGFRRVSSGSLVVHCAYRWRLLPSQREPRQGKVSLLSALSPRRFGLPQHLERKLTSHSRFTQEEAVEQRLRVLFAASEVTRLARSGGLGDVIGALPKALRTLDLDVRVVMPLYQAVRHSSLDLKPVIRNLQIPFTSGVLIARVWQAVLADPDQSAD